MSEQSYFRHGSVDHPVLEVPPLAHALHHWDSSTRELSYRYNGSVLLRVHLPGDTEPGFRHGSDGTVQSSPFLQQLYLSRDGAADAVWTEVTFSFPGEAAVMRPRRAGRNEAILGREGGVLIDGVNGLYDFDRDLLVDWHGCEWSWVRTPLPSGSTTQVRIRILLGASPWFVNLRMHWYREHLGYRHHTPWQRRPNPRSVNGWCSWEAFRREVCGRDIEAAADFFSRELKEYGFEYLQLDDGFERLPIPPNPHRPLEHGWTRTNAAFPAGHAGIIESIRSRGLQPAIWTNANVTNPDWAAAHRDVLILNRDASPLMGEWIDFLLDCTPDTLAAHVAPYYRALREAGYTYFKTDAIRHLLLDGLHEAVRLGLLSNDDAHERFRAFMACAREALGEEPYFLASWGVLSEAIGSVDACRVSMDANPTWAGLRMQMVETARWYHAQRVLFTLDPDHICARGSLEWVRSVCSLTSLSGGLFMLSDPLDAYDHPRLAIIRSCIPSLTTVTAETGPLDVSFSAFTWTKLHGFAVNAGGPVAAEETSEADAPNISGVFPTMHDQHPFGTLWAFHFERPWGEWCTLLRTAHTPLPPAQIPTGQIGLREDTPRAAFDFWNRRYLGVVSSRLTTPSLALGHCQVIGLVALQQEGPTLLGTSRHVSLLACGVRQYRPTAAGGHIELDSPPGDEVSVWVYIPPAAGEPAVTLHHAQGTTSRDGELLTITGRPATREWSISIALEHRDQ